MRTQSTAQLNAWRASESACRVRVRVADFGGTLRDVATWRGVDTLLGVTLNASLDSPTLAFSVTLHPGQPGITGAESPISPLLVGAEANASGRWLDVGRRVEIDACNVTGTPASGDWVRVCIGAVDTVSVDRSTITLTGRDFMSHLVDAVFQADQVFGATGGKPIEQVLQDMVVALLIVGDGLAITPLTIVCPVSPGFGILPYTVTKGTGGWDAMQAVVQQTSYRLAMRWTGATTQALTLFAPNRTASSADLALTASDVVAFQSAALTYEKIRTRVILTYLEKSSSTKQTVTRYNSAAETLYGIRPIVITEGATSNVDTNAEALAMADAILADLTVPPLTDSAQTLAWWAVETGDVLDLPAIAGRGDPQRLAVQTIATTWQNQTGTTTLGLGGKPAAFSGGWLSLDRRVAGDPAEEGPKGDKGDPGSAFAARCLAVPIAGDATTTTVQGRTEPGGGTVRLVDATATVVSGPGIGVSAADGTTWVFARPPFRTGTQAATLRAVVGVPGGGTASDDDSVTIEEQGRDTVPLLLRLRQLSANATTITARVSVSGPYVQRDVIATLIDAGSGGVTVLGEGGVVAGYTIGLQASTVDGDESPATGASIYGLRYFDFVTVRPTAGSAPTRVVWRVDGTACTSDLDAIDVAPQATATGPVGPVGPPGPTGPAGPPAVPPGAATVTSARASRSGTGSATQIAVSWDIANPGIVANVKLLFTSYQRETATGTVTTITSNALSVGRVTSYTLVRDGVGGHGLSARTTDAGYEGWIECYVELDNATPAVISTSFEFETPPFFLVAP